MPNIYVIYCNFFFIYINPKANTDKPSTSNIKFSNDGNISDILLNNEILIIKPRMLTIDNIDVPIKKNLV